MTRRVFVVGDRVRFNTYDDMGIGEIVSIDPTYHEIEIVYEAHIGVDPMFVQFNDERWATPRDKTIPGLRDARGFAEVTT